MNQQGTRFRGLSGCGSAYAPARLKPRPGRTLDSRSARSVLKEALIPERRGRCAGLISMVKPILPAAQTSTEVEREFILTGANLSATGEVTEGYEFEHDS
jgi:hypothetical protein